MKISCYNCGQKLDVSDLEPFSRINCPICATRLIIPKPFGDLLLEEDMGAGPMTHVYRAMDITLDREIAVKVLIEKLRGDSDLAARFVAEARSASAINHPNVIPIYSCGEMADQTYVTMQFMEGGSLKDRIGHGMPEEREVARWFLETARGLESAYIHGVVHHNIKPANIFLDVDANVKVGDFGLSRVLDSNRPMLQDDKVASPIPLEVSYYLSPEKISTGRQDVAGDIYSFGASMYHVLCGVPPFDEESVEANLKARFTAAPKPPNRVREDISTEINDLLVSALSVYPSERPRSYAEITGVLEGLAAPAKPLSSMASREKMSKTLPERERVPKPEQLVDKAPSKAKPKKKKKRVITVGASTQGRVMYDHVDDPEPPHVGLKLLRFIPLLIILVVAVLAVAHYKRFTWYENSILPIIEKVFGGEPEPKPDDTPKTTPLGDE